MNINIVIVFLFVVFSLGCAHVKTKTSFHEKQHSIEEDSLKVMSSLDIIKSTYKGDTSEENGRNLRKYLSKEIISFIRDVCAYNSQITTDEYLKTYNLLNA